MHTLALILASFLSPEPATFDIAVEGNREAVVRYGERVLTPGETYRLSPFIGTREVTLSVTYDNGDRLVRDNITFTVEAGYDYTLTITVPRNRGAIALVRGP